MWSSIYRREKALSQQELGRGTFPVSVFVAEDEAEARAVLAAVEYVTEELQRAALCIYTEPFRL